MTVILDTGLLEELERGLRAQRAPVVDVLQPGIGAEEVQRLVATRGLRLPLEAERWFVWHNGASSALPVRERQLGPAHAALSLEEALGVYDWNRQLAVDAANHPGSITTPDDWWDPQWFPLTTNDLGLGPAAVDCSVPEGAPTPIRRVDWHVGLEVFHEPGAASLGVLVAWWIEALDTGRWRYDHAKGYWATRDELLTPEQRRSALV